MQTNASGGSMNITEIINARGQVTPHLLNVSTGETIAWETRHNTLSYSATEAMARAFGGDTSLTPTHIGFIYGNKADTSFESKINRDQNWESLHRELQEKSADVQVQPFSYSPTIKKLENINAQGVIFHAHSDSYTSGAFGTCRDGSSGEKKAFDSDTYIFQAVLLNKTAGNSTILARVSLKGAEGYVQKPKDFEIALDWTVKFF